MNYKELLSTVDKKIKGEVQYRRYNLSDIISESYKSLYDCEQGTNLQRLAEAHLQDVRDNPTDIDRLSRQLCNIREIIRMNESGEIKDSDLSPAPRRIRESDVIKPRFDNRKVKETKKCPECGQYPCICDNIDEADDPDLTDEEVEELAKHLDSIRKERKNPSQEKDLEETDIPKRKGIRCKTHTNEQLNNTKDPAEKEKLNSEIDAYNEKADYADDHNDASGSIKARKRARDLQEKSAPCKGIRCKTHENCKECDEPTKGKKKELDEARYGSNEITREDISNIIGTLEEIQEEMSARSIESIRLQPNTYGVYPPYLATSEGFLSLNSETLFYDEDEEDYYESKKVEGKKLKESKDYSSLKEGLSNFGKSSSSKAFYKTFKKMSDSLKEGKALTRQESINLYKAANSAMTQLSVELEHNPEFLSTFNECTTLLSADVARLLESMQKGKAPSKNNMKSLAKFAESILVEANEEDEDEEDIIPEEEPTEDEDFVGDEEGDIASEEEDEFDQEYADARVELHKDLVDKHADDEDPGIQEKIAQDEEEVLNLPGITDEQVAEITGEGSSEDTEEPETDETPDEEEPAEEESPEDSEDEISDDELAELKKHLKEMRLAKKRK